MYFLYSAKTGNKSLLLATVQINIFEPQWQDLMYTTSSNIYDFAHRKTILVEKELIKFTVSVQDLETNMHQNFTTPSYCHKTVTYIFYIFFICERN